MTFLRALGRFWYDFIVGDDWRIALGVTLVLAAGAVVVVLDAVADGPLVITLACGIVAVVTASIVVGARR